MPVYCAAALRRLSEATLTENSKKMQTREREREREREWEEVCSSAKESKMTVRCERF